MSMFVEFKESQFTVKGSKMSTVPDYRWLFKASTRCASCSQDVWLEVEGFKSFKGGGRQEAMPPLPMCNKWSKNLTQFKDCQYCSS